MAQLPPKVPNQNWPPTFPPHQRMPPLTSPPPPPPPQKPPQPTSASAMWADEFLDFTSTRRGTHRRSMSDSIAFLESPLLEECRNSLHASAGAGTVAGGFDRLDDEVLMSIVDSDHNAMNVNSSENNVNHYDADSTNFDPKRVKRILANRQSAQRSRVRKLQYISELERSVTSLQTEVSTLSPRVAYLDHQRLILNVDNSAIKQRIAALAQDKIFKDAHQEALKKEIDRLRQVYHHQQQQQQQHQQNMKMMGGVAANCGNTAATATAQPSISDHNMDCSDKEQLMT
ncbi:hypothetical protein KSS87_007915 [Heliosperma pusillum]|nr:hypothetical protein KSS87_007915 [Heliosperma pusillum]